jgi:integrase
MVERIRAHERCLAARKESVKGWKVPVEVRADVLRFIAELDLGKANRGRRISEARQVKYLDLLRMPLEYLAMPLTRLRLQDIEGFEKALSSDALRSTLKRKAYAYATKVDMRKALKILLRWRLGEAKALKLAGWLDTRNQPKTPDFLCERDVERLLKGCSTAEQRYLIAVLFDSGARIEEFMNIRFEDVGMPEEKDNFAKLTLKQEFSKTLGRTISLYWRHSAEAVREYAKQRIAGGTRSEDPVFSAKYDTIRMFLARLGQRVLGKHVHPHLFRHSSATYYATKLNWQELCYRYGWRFSSNMPDVYISLGGESRSNRPANWLQSLVQGRGSILARQG